MTRHRTRGRPGRAAGAAAAAATLVAVACGAGPAAAQGAEPNWMADFVASRVALQTLRAASQSAGRAAEPDLRAVVRPKIVGGTNAGTADNPFQVALLNRSVANNRAAQFCGGTLIRANVVVTAAHCSDFTTAAQVQVLSDARRLDGTGTRRDVARITIHPGWNAATFDNDVAVWELSSPVAGATLATLATDDGAVGANLLATGWGALTEGGSAPVDLQRVEVPLVDRANCNDANSYNGAITANMICAGLDAGGRDSCQGDSGGPLTRGPGNAVLTGIVSWGTGCARPNLYGIYTRVSQPGIRGFIEDAARRAEATELFQLHNTGAIWRHTDAPCGPGGCPGWQLLDTNPQTRAIAASSGGLFQIHGSGAIWRYTGSPCGAGGCPGWQLLDNNPRGLAIAASGPDLFQLHNTGAIWRHTGTPCGAGGCPGWQMLDNNPRTLAVAAGTGGLYQLHNTGAIWRHTGTPCGGGGCPGWQLLDNNARTVAIVASGPDLYQLHNTGAVWRHTGTPCGAGGCPGWQLLDNNPRTMAIAAGAGGLYQLHNTGAVWRHTGTPCGAGGCPGWELLDNNSQTREIAAAGSELFQMHGSGVIWRYTGTPCGAGGCPGWQALDNNPRTRAMAVSDD